MFSTKIINHRTLEIAQGGYLDIAIESFLTDRKAGGCAKGTVEFYARKLIKNIVSSWLHLQWVEMNLTYQWKAGSDSTMVEWWDKRVSAAQRRYFRAIGTLARVRKLARNTPSLQVNIATEGGQQINASGDLKRG